MLLTLVLVDIHAEVSVSSDTPSDCLPSWESDASSPSKVGLGLRSLFLHDAQKESTMHSKKTKDRHKHNGFVISQGR
jgi:hypothetical protein